MRDAGAGRMARRKVKSGNSRLTTVTYADAAPSAFASLLGGLIEANVEKSAAKRKDLDSLDARVGVFVTDIGEGVTLELDRGTVTVHNGLSSGRDLTIRADAGTVMNLSNLRIGMFGMPVYFDSVGRGVVRELVRRRLRIEGLLGNVATLNTLTRILSVR